MSFSDWREALLNALSRGRCAACDLDLDPQDEPFCPGCAILLDEVPPERLPPHHDAALFSYAGPLASAITTAKYGADFVRVASLARLFDARVFAYASRVDAVVPVPLHHARLQERGFNVSTLFAQRIARSIRMPIAHALVRVRPTQTQAGLGAADRRINVHGAFACAWPVEHMRVLLVDDVRTTGATLREAANALRLAGARSVHTLALAWADDAPSHAAR